jgi:hypothetical protein
VRERKPAASKEDILKVLEKMENKDMNKLSTDSHYYNPIFTPYVGGFQIDLLQSSRRTDDDDDFPPFFFVAINDNTRYGYAYPMDNKSVPEILRVLNEWESDVENVGREAERETGKRQPQRRLVQITADEESGWNDDEGAVKRWMNDRKIKLKLIPSDRHSSLGIIDRFIRTLRDMNVRSSKEGNQGSGGEDDKRKYRDFTPQRMAKLLNIYNHAEHSSTGMTPLEMEENPDEQKRYIIKKVYEVHNREKISDFNLDQGQWVRFMIPKDMMHKQRFKVSPEVVQIKGRDGKAYILMAQDGTTKTMSRWRLFPVNPDNYKKLASFHSGRGIISKVIGGPRDGKYEVEWEHTTGGRRDTSWESERTIVGQENGRELLDRWKNRRQSGRHRR